MKFNVYIEPIIVLFKFKIDKYYIYNFENFNEKFFIKSNLKIKIIIPFVKKPGIFSIF